MVYYYDSGIHGLKGGDSTTILEQDSGLFPTRHSDYEVFNIGRSPVYCALKYGTKIAWIGNITTAIVKPGERKMVMNNHKPYYVTALKLQNDTSKRVITCAHYEGGGSDYPDEKFEFDMNVNNVLRELVAAGIKYVPYVGSGLSFLVKLFWPEQKKSVWEQVRDQVTSLVDQKILEAINALLAGDIAQYKSRIQTIVDEIKDKKDASAHYMNIAQDLIGFENKFIFTKTHPDYKKINYSLLPMYSYVIHMKLMFYLIGLDQKDEIHLTKANVEDIKKYADKLLNDKENGAFAYIKKVYKEQVDECYDTVDVRGYYNSMMLTRAYVAVNGLEYIPIWDYMLKNPSAKDPKIYNDAISYSVFHGRQTPNLTRVATPDDQEEPLTPRLISGKRNKIKSVTVYVWRINSGRGPPNIGGLKVNFEDGKEYMMGKSNDENKTIEWKNARLEKLSVWGWGALDQLTFKFSDGREESFGTNDNSRNHVTHFELKKHHIVGMVLTTDSPSTGGQATNIAVSYQLTVE
ncbi:uncharacterized protein LOC109599065 [Aethina tumida]|uniref:uncharacterized protein LOC109599065 n=1 Tax=Aethina tumida TaxID=116153 RepID=UPI002148B00F|nr:uncharacterized protein LOC109599065 [Aethina tumida]